MVTHKKNKETKPKKKTAKIVGFSILGVLVVLLIIGGIYLYQALKQPKSLFTVSSVNVQSAKKAITEDIETPTPSASVYPLQTPPPSIEDNIVNVLLLGMDSAYLTYPAGDEVFHTDSIIVLAINFDKNTVDMISLPRNTYVPDITGFYNLKSAMNYGGGKTDAGFKKTCEAASWMLGGISIDYYYAFELDTVIEIGDMIGGVDFDVDMGYKGNSGTLYKKGMQHLDGTGIYDYMRARMNATSGAPGDKGRTDRGMAILKAISKKLKEKNMLTQFPGLLSAIDKGLYTNITLQQSIALANFAYSNIDMNKIGSHTMECESFSVLLNWDFYLIDQKVRAALIEEVYGIDVPELQYVSYEYAKWLGDYGFKTTRYLTTSYDLSQYIISKGEDTLSTEQQESYTALKEAYKKVQAAYNAAALSFSISDNTEMETASEELRKSAEALAKLVNYPDKLSWPVK
jgi:polyisoprenyl-teichoic acid--peptidoglycan teichoic acid transferase